MDAAGVGHAKAEFPQAADLADLGYSEIAISVRARPGVNDKYLPSYLVHARHGPQDIHVLFAADVDNGNVRVVTAYYPDPKQWEDDMKRRRR